MELTKQWLEHLKTKSFCLEAYWWLVNFVFKWKSWVLTGCLFCFQVLAQNEYNQRKQRSRLFLHNKTFMEGKVSSLKFVWVFLFCVTFLLFITGFNCIVPVLIDENWTKGSCCSVSELNVSSLESIWILNIASYCLLLLFPHFSIVLKQTTWLTQFLSLLNLQYKVLILKWKCFFLEQVLGVVVSYVP